MVNFGKSSKEVQFQKDSCYFMAFLPCCSCFYQHQARHQKERSGRTLLFNINLSCRCQIAFFFQQPFSIFVVGCFLDIDYSIDNNRIGSGDIQKNKIQMVYIANSAITGYPLFIILLGLGL